MNACGIPGEPQGTESAIPAGREGNPPGLRAPSGGDGGNPFVSWTTRGSFRAIPWVYVDVTLNPIHEDLENGEAILQLLLQEDYVHTTRSAEARARQRLLRGPVGSFDAGHGSVAKRHVTKLFLQKAKEPELVKPGLVELPKLAELSGNSAIDVGAKPQGRLL